MRCQVPVLVRGSILLDQRGVPVMKGNALSSEVYLRSARSQASRKLCTLCYIRSKPGFLEALLLWDVIRVNMKVAALRNSGSRS